MIVIVLANETKTCETPSINAESIRKVEHSSVLDLQSMTSQQNRRNIYEKLTSNVIFAVFSSLRMPIWMLMYILIFSPQWCTNGSNQCEWAVKRNKRHLGGKKEVKPFLFSVAMTIHTENSGILLKRKASRNYYVTASG